MYPYIITRQYNPSEENVPTFGEQGFFFNEWIHLRQQSTHPIHLLTVFNTETRQAEARCAFFDTDPLARSPAAAPFGSVEFIETLPDAALQTLVRSLSDEAHRAGQTQLIIVNYPHCYAPLQADRLTRLLLQQGFQLTDNQANYFISVTDCPLEAHMHMQERRRLRKGRLAGLTFDHWEAPVISEVIDFWYASRQQQGYELTLPPERLLQLLAQFPERFPVFVVRSKQTIAALSIGVRVRNDILYNFLPVDNLAFRHLSPMVFLLNGLYAYCQDQAIRVLDLGVSLDANRQPKPSLEHFKRNMGAMASPKLIFEKRLNSSCSLNTMSVC